MLKHLYKHFDRWLTGSINPDPIVLASFASRMESAGWQTFSDASFGGKSKASLSVGPDQNTGVFHGTWSKDKSGSAKLIRSGYAGMNKAWTFTSIDLSMHDYIDWHIKGDGNTYVASLRVNQMTGGDEEAWQAPLKTSTGQWEKVRINLDDFLFTFRGRLSKAKGSVGLLPRKEIIALGISLSASEAMPETGSFSLEIKEVVAGAHEVVGLEARRKAFRGDLEFKEDILTQIRVEEERSGAGGGGASSSGSRANSGPLDKALGASAVSIGGKSLKRKLEVKQTNE
jgi:NADH dehydrogenase [ubiquinone] 1 alpha subcomplex assembly factor 1